MKFHVDNNLPPALARPLDELSSNSEIPVEKVIALRERFAPSTADEIWLAELAAEGEWNIVSGDNVRKSTAERELMRRAGFNVFVLQKSWSSQKFWQKSAQLLLCWPRTIDYSSKSQRIAARVPWKLSGKFEQIRL